MKIYGSARFGKPFAAPRPDGCAHDWRPGTAQEPRRPPGTAQTGQRADIIDERHRRIRTAGPSRHRLAPASTPVSGRHSLLPLRYPALKSSAAFSTPLTVLPVTSPTVEHPAPKNATRQATSTHSLHMETSASVAQPKPCGPAAIEFKPGRLSGRTTCRTARPPCSHQTRHGPRRARHEWWSGCRAIRP